MEEMYVIFNVEELNKVDFTKVMEDSSDTVRVSPDGLKAVVAWYGNDIPEFVAGLETKEGVYTKEEVLPILRSDYWNKIIE
jgi:hypothetical protein